MTDVSEMTDAQQIAAVVFLMVMAWLFLATAIESGVAGGLRKNREWLEDKRKDTKS